MYIETTIVSYLTARPSRDLVQRAHQQLTRRWWQARRAKFDLYGRRPLCRKQPEAIHAVQKKRLAALKAIPVLEATPEAMQLAAALIGAGQSPSKRPGMQRMSPLRRSMVLSTSPPGTARTSQTLRFEATSNVSAAVRAMNHPFGARPKN